ncbi:hypothetical protein GP486_007747 [Trichoglossum hirsutum]|uniref:Fungal-type protein kinase domain-containing protein n=1 Tax=Trichoglossum hirsutum TaxID=265104 RepID=A0A9P8IC76_9PEZI|nr:hypothetical protein GP486_007747 [Trichoglossum hirsutum]
MEVRAEIIRANPIGDALDVFRNSFYSACAEMGISSSLDAAQLVGEEGLKNRVVELIGILLYLPAAPLLDSNVYRTLDADLFQVQTSIRLGRYDIKRTAPLLDAVLRNKSDEIIWDKARVIVTEVIPPHSTPSTLSFLDQTPLSRNASSFVNSSEHRKDVDGILKEELGRLYIGIPRFFDIFFRDIIDLETAAAAVFKKCKDGNDPLYSDDVGWRGWPEDAHEEDVLKWLFDILEAFLNFAEQVSAPRARRALIARPNQPLKGSTAPRKLDVGLVNDQAAGKDASLHWSCVLVPGELKRNPNADTSSRTWLDLGRYVREVFAAQDNRRFVQGFTLCGSTLRRWEFDRIGGIASSPIDVNRNGLDFIYTMLGYLWMNDEQLGFDPTICASGDKRYIEITRNGQKERLIIDHLMRRAPCIVGRATTCWLTYREEDKSKKMPYVVKDSWQYPEREEEGILLREATEKGVVNVARYYHHETVCVGGMEDDIQNNVRKGLDIGDAANYGPRGSTIALRSGSTSRNTSVGQKRISNNSITDTGQPASKRQCTGSSTKSKSPSALWNRVHRRVIIRDYGKPLYKASTRAALLAALEGCIDGYESLHHDAGLLQRDISIGNLMMNEDGANNNPSWPSFLIDLDLAIKEKRIQASGARSITGTRAFIGIKGLYNKGNRKHSFMDDMESMFWVLYWICIHYNGAYGGKSLVTSRFDTWNFIDAEDLAKLKSGIVVDEEMFIWMMEKDFTDYYKPLIPWVNELRKVVFPDNKAWVKEDKGLYSRMKKVLQEARNDPKVLAE